MADVNFFDNFETPWALNGGTETIDENQYKQGWAFIGATPPSVEQFNKVQQLNDEKAAWLFAQFRTLADETGHALTADMGDALTKGIAGAMQSGSPVVATDIGTTNAYVVNYSPAIAALEDGMALWFQVKSANTGASTLNVNGTGPMPILGMGHGALQGAELAANGKALVVWKQDSGSWVLVGCSGGASQVPSATRSMHAMQLGQAVGRLIGVKVFTASGTYTPTAGTTSVIVEAQGGGGAGGGTPVTAGGQTAISASGGSGSYGMGRYTSGFSPSVPVTVGIGGTSTVAGGGGNGGTSSFGSLLSAFGGSGAASGGVVGPPPRCLGGAAGGGLPAGANIVGVPGASGGPTFALDVITNVLGGRGGKSRFGEGGPWTASSQGGHAVGRGAGGGGVGAGQAVAAVPGGNGAPGIVIVWEFA
jgi:hypothetical protein